MFFNKDKIKKFLEPETVTLTHYIIKFRTVDGVDHEFNRMSYIDENAIICSPLEYYLIGKEYLKDDEGVFYPMNNIISIRAVKDETINNVVEKSYGGSFRYTWYCKGDIEIYNEELTN